MTDKIKYLIIGAVGMCLAQLIIIPVVSKFESHSDRPFFTDWFKSKESKVSKHERGSRDETRKRSDSGYGYDDDEYDGIR